MVRDVVYMALYAVKKYLEQIQCFRRCVVCKQQQKLNCSRLSQYIRYNKKEIELNIISSNTVCEQKKWGQADVRNIVRCSSDSHTLSCELGHRMGHLNYSHLLLVPHCVYVGRPCKGPPSFCSGHEWAAAVHDVYGTPATSLAPVTNRPTNGAIDRTAKAKS